MENIKTKSIKKESITIRYIIIFIIICSAFSSFKSSGYKDRGKSIESTKLSDSSTKIKFKEATLAIEEEGEKTCLDLGEFHITVYTPECDGGRWGYQTATGVTSKHLVTCAVDPKVIPLGSKIKVNGLELTAVDTGSSVKGYVIDIFYDGTRSQAYRWIASFGTNHIVSLCQDS